VSGHSAISDFRHEAVFYRDAREFVDTVAQFIADGVAAGEPTLVMVSGPKIDALRARIGSGADGLVEYRDMQVVGANPARIIPAWDEFAIAGARSGAARMRGVGEPIWPGRGAVQLEECQWHEALINRAFADVQGFWLICPYDVPGLDPGVIEGARTTHPVIGNGRGAVAAEPDAGREDFQMPSAPLSSRFAPPATVVAEMPFAAATLRELRALVATQGARAGLAAARLDDLILAVSEVATNSVTHGAGRGVARIWFDDGDVVCEIADRGVISDPLVDRQRPGADLTGARGLWTANQLCDLVQLRSSREMGSVVRLRMHAGRRAA
jgi:anti-sigma regulatory factor (Ser/Thr protein kinase)